MKKVFLINRLLFLILLTIIVLKVFDILLLPINYHYVLIGIGINFLFPFAVVGITYMIYFIDKLTTKHKK